jgi:hypothetical protein
MAYGKIEPLIERARDDARADIEVALEAVEDALHQLAVPIMRRLDELQSDVEELKKKGTI